MPKENVEIHGTSPEDLGENVLFVGQGMTCHPGDVKQND